MEFQIPRTGWIWNPVWNGKAFNQTVLVYFRKKIMIDRIPDFLQIEISADSRYKLYVNGELICIGPSKGDRSVWFYDTVDLAPYMCEGENVIAVEVLRYPPFHKKGSHSVFRTDIPGLYIKECVQKESQPIGLDSNATWKCHLVDAYEIIQESLLFSPLCIFENRTSEIEMIGWKEKNYSDENWEIATEYNILQMDKGTSPGNLQKRTIPYMRLERKQFKKMYGKYCCTNPKEEWIQMFWEKGTVHINEKQHVTVEISAEELVTGFLSLRVKGGKDAEVKILTSEGYVQEVDCSNPLNTIVKKGRRCDDKNGILHGFTDCYVFGAASNQTEIYEPFWFRTFRFIQLEITTKEEPIEIIGFDYLDTGYPLEVKTHVETSDHSLSAIWDISERTLKRCMHETYEDCPFYEQLQYAMDSRSQILYTYMISADDRLARKCMDDFKKSQRYDGMINCSYPCYGPNVIPGFSIYYILMLYDHMMYFGDKALLRDHMGTVDRILEFFNQNLDERGLVGKVGGLNVFDRYWSFIDWTTQWNDTTGVPKATMQGPITMESLLYVMGLKHAAEIMNYLGRDGIADEYIERAIAVQNAINEYCKDENDMYLDGPGVFEYSQHCQVFALLTDTVDIATGRINLEKTIQNPDEFAQCSVAMSFYLFRALQKADMYDQINTKWDTWRMMIANQLTTCVEDNVNERSDCHAWGAVALFELPAVTLGVQPAEPGYRTIRINPVPGYLSWAKGDVVTPHGIVHVEWKESKDGRVELQYEIPQNTKVCIAQRKCDEEK